MFPVEIRIRDDDALTPQMNAMREWLDHRHLEPSTFRYTFNTFALPGIIFQVDFSTAAEAAMFAREFGGRVIGASADTSIQAAD